MPTISRLKQLIHDYPQQFWLLLLVSFIDRVGGALLFPFFTLYITAKFGVGMTTVGIIFGIFSISAIAGSAFGGALSDRFGRKRMIIFGLVISATVTLMMGFARHIYFFFVASVLVGLFANMGDPARQAMVADLLEPKQRAEGYSLMRIVTNLAMTLGPAIGGFMAARSYQLLFISDFVASGITAIIFALLINETLPTQKEDEPDENFKETLLGYKVALRDKVFMVFIVASIFEVLVYMQMNTTLAVFLRDVRHLPTQYYGYLISLNALTVVLFQFLVTRSTRRFRSLHLIAAGTFLYAVGFGMYGLVQGYRNFVLAMLVITLGEMLVVPVAQSVVALLAPERMRGRYMAVFGFSWALPIAVGPLLAGMIMDYGKPNWVWYAAFILASLSALIFLWLAGRTRKLDEVPQEVAA
jgi:MFS family permease